MAHVWPLLTADSIGSPQASIIQLRLHPCTCRPLCLTSLCQNPFLSCVHALSFLPASRCKFFYQSPHKGMPHLCPNLRYGYGENSVERLLVVYLGLGLSWVCGICFMKCLLFSWPSSSWVLLQVFFKFLLFHVYGCFPCMYVYIIGIKEGVISNKSLWVTIWVLGSFTEAVSALNHRVTSPLLSLPPILFQLPSVPYSYSLWVTQSSSTSHIGGTFLLFLFRGTMSFWPVCWAWVLYFQHSMVPPIKLSLSLVVPVWRCVNIHLGTVKSSQWRSLISMLN